jgi:hypothetical protein
MRIAGLNRAVKTGIMQKGTRRSENVAKLSMKSWLKV